MGSFPVFGEEGGDSLPNQRVRKHLTRIAAGHASRGGESIYGTDYDEKGKARMVLKKFCEEEHDIYLRLISQDLQLDPIQKFIPHMSGTVDDVTEADGTKGKYMRLTNLLYPLQFPKVMDVKLGVRTFLESEAANTKLRPDLFERMVSMYPHEVTQDDADKKGITKHRWMSVRDANSTSGTLGYRIDGVAGTRNKTKQELDDMFGEFRSREETILAFRYFVDSAATDDGELMDAASMQTTPLKIAESVTDQLVCLRAAMEKSSFCAEHECIGTSLLLVADTTGHTGVFWIDFAKTKATPEGVRLDHRAAWVPGNHEDGMLFGLDGMIDAWRTVTETILREDEEDKALMQKAGGLDSMTTHCGEAAVTSARKPGGFCRCCSKRRSKQSTDGTMPVTPQDSIEVA
jgi:hypothetical protein